MHVRHWWLLVVRTVCVVHLASLCGLLTAGQEPLRVTNPVHDIEHMHFGLTYHGENDLPIQRLVSRLFHVVSPEVQAAADWLVTPRWQGFDWVDSSQQPPRMRRRIRVGFFSKFFHVNHAHGQLLEARCLLHCSVSLEILTPLPVAVLLTGNHGGSKSRPL